MRKSIQIRQDLQTKITAQRAIVEGAKDEKGEKRSLTQEETTNFDTLQDEITALRSELQRAEQFEENERAAAAATATPVTTTTTDSAGDEMRSMKKRYSLHKAIRSQLPNGKLDGVELEIHQETVARAKESGVLIEGVAIPAPSKNRSEQKRADGQTVTQDSGNFGANLVAEELQAPIEFLRPRPILESMGARMLTGLSGNVAFPTNDGGVAASWEGEIDVVPATKTAYGKKTMSPNRLAAYTPISLQNLIQSSPDLEAMTIADLNAVMANALDIAGINGPGSGGVPEGILNLTGLNTVDGGTNGAAPTWEHIVDLETAIHVANANGARMGYLINSATKGRLKKTKHEAGDLGYLMDRDNTINGYNVGVSNLVPSDLTKGTGTNLSAGIFGDFSQLLMGQFGFYDLTVDNITKKKDGNIEIIINAFFDVLARHDKSFAAIKDWIIS